MTTEELLKQIEFNLSKDVDSENFTSVGVAVFGLIEIAKQQEKRLAELENRE